MKNSRLTQDNECFDDFHGDAIRIAGEYDLTHQKERETLPTAEYKRNRRAFIVDMIGELAIREQS